MDEWKKILITPQTEIHKAIEIIDMNALQIALVIDSDHRLLGTVTDGDVRRGLLKNISLDSPVHQIMNKSPVTIPIIKDRKSILNILKINKLRHLPVVDEAGRIIGIERLDDLIQPVKNDNLIVLMAGGMGKRLRPLTNNCPKPMLPVGGRPILETTIAMLVEQGFRQFCLSVNYKEEEITSYFGDGSRLGSEIHYIREGKNLGTAGPLSLIPNKTEKPIIVMNGDILTKLKMDQLIDFHDRHQTKATIAVRSYDYQVPYGVINAVRDRLVGFEEKPIYTSMVNAGIYVINPEVIDRIPKDSCFDMDQLFQNMLEGDEPLSIFPVREYWIDIGTIEDYNQAQLDFYEVFQ